MPANATAQSHPEPHGSGEGGVRKSSTRHGESRAGDGGADSLKGEKGASRARLSNDLGLSWLAWQCRMVAGIIRGGLYLADEQEQIGTDGIIWPGEGEGLPQLQDAASQACRDRRSVLRSQQAYGPGGQRTCDLIAAPLQLNGKLLAVVAVMVSTRSEPQQHAVLQLLQWGGLWLETMVLQESKAKQEVGEFTLALMSSVISHSAIQVAAMEVVNRLSEWIGCERVSLGFRSGFSVRMAALSHVSSFDPRTQLIRRIEVAMEESVDQSAVLVHPGQTGQPHITKSHAELAEQHGHGSICTIPLPGRSGTIGAITLERPASQPFDPEMLAWCESLARLIGPALDMRRQEERSIWSRGTSVLRRAAGRWFGPSNLKLKMAGMLAAGAVTVLAWVDGDFRVTAPANIEGGVRQLLVAPQEGYVDQAKVRAGDTVIKGQLIAALDDRNLQFELKKWESERNKIEKEYQEALAKRDRTQLSIFRAKLDQVDAEMHLVEEKMERTQLRAPFDGVVLRGDLSQSLGSPVEKGQVLYEVAPLDSYRVVLEVDEHDVAGLDQSRSGHLIVAALPQSTFGLTLDKVIPVAAAAEGRNFFKVEAIMSEPSDLLRPGMHGVAKIDMGQRSLLWIWTHSLVSQMRLWVWSIGL